MRLLFLQIAPTLWHQRFSVLLMAPENLAIFPRNRQLVFRRCVLRDARHGSQTALFHWPASIARYWKAQREEPL